MHAQTKPPRVLTRAGSRIAPRIESQANRIEDGKTCWVDAAAALACSKRRPPNKPCILHPTIDRGGPALPTIPHPPQNQPSLTHHASRGSGHAARRVASTKKNNHPHRIAPARRGVSTATQRPLSSGESGVRRSARECVCACRLDRKDCLLPFGPNQTFRGSFVGRWVGPRVSETRKLT